jgi:hypothetical protein
MFNKFVTGIYQLSAVNDRRIFGMERLIASHICLIAPDCPALTQLTGSVNQREKVHFIAPVTGYCVGTAEQAVASNWPNSDEKEIVTVQAAGADVL